MAQIIDSKTAAAAILIALGALLMTISLVRYKSILDNQSGCRTKTGRRLKILHSCHVVLMAFFIVGYLVVLVSLSIGVFFASELLVGLIFFFGAVFVLFGVIIQQWMLARLRDTYTNSVKMLVSAVEIRDPYTIGHSEHVANLLLVMHDYLPADVRMDINKNTLEHAGLLHDIGKIGVPETVLNKSTRLNEQDWKMIREHPETGSNLIGNLEELKGIADWVKYHHERVDGNGYYRISEQSIPYVSKLIAVVDTYSALVTDRPYRKGRLHEEAVHIMMECSNTQLDAELVNIFASIPQMHIQSCRPDALVRAYCMEHQLADNFGAEPCATHSIDVILPREPGAEVLAKMLDHAVLKKLHLSFVAMTMEKLSVIDRENGYHAADELGDAFGNELLRNIRQQDVIMQLNRSTFILALTECQSTLAIRRVERIDKVLQQAPFFDSYRQTVAIHKDFICYNPDKVDTLEEARRFIATLAVSSPLQA